MALSSSHAGLYYAAAVVVFLLVYRWYKKPRDPRQPKQVPATIPIPFVGHTIGLLIWRNHYYTKISRQWNLPIISLPMFGANVYVSKSPELLYSLQRQPKSLSFWYFEAEFTSRLGKLTESGTNGCFRGVRPESTDGCPLIDCLKGVKTAMSAQGDLNKMSQVATKSLDRAIKTLVEEARGPVDLEAWVKHEVMLASTDAAYGPKNPFRDPATVEAFWDFTDQVLYAALPNILTNVLAPKAFAGRDTVARAVEQYYESGGLQNSAQLPLARYTILKESGMSIPDIARAECVFGLALNGNSVPAAFWVVWQIFSNADVLVRIREEVEALVSTAHDESQDIQIRTMDLRRVKEAQYLHAAIQETLRYRARGTGPRMVLEDVTLSSDECEYHLEKGSTLMLAHEGMHYDTTVWGPNAGNFSPDRFLPGNKIPANAFRGFGGGSNLCPGKSFAVAEIASLVAMLVTRVNLNPVGGRWDDPGQDVSNMARENPPPLRKVMVDISSRPGSENVVWKYTI